MQLGKLDHVNVRTANLESMTQWYGNILGMSSGARPGFAFPGAWLYCGGDPAVHLIGVGDQPEVTGLRLEHFAFSASGYDSFIERLRQAGERYETRKVPGFDIVQVNIWDPDGNHIHVDFPSSEAGDVQG